MKKSNLPKNWIVCSSRSYPDRVYYFNTVTNKTSWIMPVGESDNQERSTGNVRKRKRNSDTETTRPRTPKVSEEKERPVVKSKRRISHAHSKKIASETPQMKEIREKMLEKQAKLIKVLKSDSSGKKVTLNELKEGKSLISANNAASERGSTQEDTENSKKEATVNMRSRYPVSVKSLSRIPNRRQSFADSESPKEENAFVPSCSASPLIQNMTPQMRLLYDRLEKKKAEINKRLHQNSSQSSTSSLSGSKSSSMSCSTLNFNSSTTSNSLNQTSSTSSVTGTTSTLGQSDQNTIIKKRIIEEAETPSAKKVPEQKEEVPGTIPLTRKLRRSSVRDRRRELGFPISRSASDYAENLTKDRPNKLRENRIFDGTRRIQESSRSLLSNRLDSDSPPTVYVNAAERAKAVRARVLNYQTCNAELEKVSNSDGIENADDPEEQLLFARLNDSNNDPYYEEMEWEPIEDEKIMSEVQVVRSQLYDAQFSNSMTVGQNNCLDLQLGSVQEAERRLYIVIDTNVLLSNLKAVEEARDSVFKSFGRPFIVIPWTVLQELDFIKNDKSMTRPESIKSKARRAVRFLYHNFSTKHPRILGQTPEDVARNRKIFSVECPDDEILQSCLQIRNAKRTVVLFSYDENLCNKAMIYNISTLGRRDLFEKIDNLNIIDTRYDSFYDNQVSYQEKNSMNITTTLDRELLIAEDIFEKTKAALLHFLSPVVINEMKNLFGDVWERYTIIRPPWSTRDVLKCALKHWMAAVSESFTRRAEQILKELFDTIIHSPNGGRRLKNVYYFLERCNDLVQTLHQQKYPDLINRTLSEINFLKKKCLGEIKGIHHRKIRDEIGEDDIGERNARVDVTLDYFNKVYAFTRDFCGIAAETINMPCTFLYEKKDKIFTKNFVDRYQPEVAANLNYLLQVLSRTLEDLNGLHPNHKAVIALTEALVKYFPAEGNNPETKITPLDVYCCIKTKEDVMRRGLTQLQDLSAQFCRMASHRCR